MNEKKMLADISKDLFCNTESWEFCENNGDLMFYKNIGENYYVEAVLKRNLFSYGLIITCKKRCNSRLNEDIFVCKSSLSNERGNNLWNYKKDKDKIESSKKIEEFEKTYSEYQEEVCKNSPKSGIPMPKEEEKVNWADVYKTL